MQTTLRPEPLEIGWNWLDLLIVILVAVVAGAGSSMLAAQVFPSAQDQGLASPVAFIGGSSLYLASIAAVGLLAVRRSGAAAVGLRQTTWLNYLIVFPLFLLGVFGLAAANLLVSAALGRPFENPQTEAISGGQPIGGFAFFTLWVLVALIAPLAEEIYFRGMLFGWLQKHLSNGATLVASAAIFAAVHFIDVLIPGLFVLGLILGYLRLRSGSIWPGVLYHMIQNSIALFAINSLLAQG